MLSIISQVCANAQAQRQCLCALGYVLLCCKSVPSEDFIKEVFHVIKRLLEPCADSVCRGAGLAAVGACIPLEVMAGCRDDLSLFYSLAANCAHLVAGVTVFGAGRGLCADEFGDVLMVVVVDGCIQESFVAQITNLNAFHCSALPV